MYPHVLCLGYPPPDNAVRDFLTKKTSESESHLRACCFTEALFDHTLVVLRSSHFEVHWEIQQVAVKFRSLMTAGQSMKGHNEFRTRFYNEVVRLAEEKLGEARVCLLDLERYCRLIVT
jgi:hypothetical protein